MTHTVPLPWAKPPLTLNTSQEVPCERCVFIPTPTGSCICREKES